VSVVVVGLNHRTVPLDLLERMTVPSARLAKALADLAGRDHIGEAIVLSTCHRTEVYAVAEKFHGAVSDIRNFLGDLAFAPPEEFSDHLYTYYDEAAAAHLFGVAAGLDSVVLGESEIIGQVKDAWDAARAEKTCGATLSGLFRHALETGKRARTDTGIARHITSVPQAAVAMATERLGSLAGSRVLVLGAGEMGEALAVALAGAGVAEVLVANRSAPRARAVARRVGGRPVSLFELPDALAAADVLLTSTGATTPVVDAEDVAPVLGARQGRPLLIVDVAMPRDVDASVAALDGVTLLDLEDLKRFAEAGLDERRREVAAVRGIIGEEVARYLERATERQVAPAISALRERAEKVRIAELDRYRARLDGLDDRQRDAVEALTRGIVAKLLHDPTVRLKDAAGGPKGERLAEALRDLFGL
jgi:glutamyl-tRNA reductase